MTRGRVARLLAVGVWVGALGCGGDDGVGAADGGTIEPCDAGVPAVPEGECGASADCRSGVCRLDPDAAPRDDVRAVLGCGEPRGTGGSGARCVGSSDCASGLCLVAGTCAEACVEDEDCGVGDRCVRGWVPVAEDAMQWARVCVPRFVLPPAVSVTAGPSAVLPAMEGDAFEVALPAPEGRALHILDVTCGPAPTPRLLRAEGPERILFDADAVAPGSEAPLNPVARGTEPVTVLLPNGPAWMTGPVVLSLASRGAGRLEGWRLERSEPGTRLDVDLFYVGGRGWTAEGDRGPEPVAQALDGLEALLEPAGIRLGEVRQHDVVGAVQRRFAVLDGGLLLPDEATMLFRLSAGSPTPSVAFFFVRSVDGGLGLAGGVPGPQGLQGSGGSGIAIGVDLLPSLADLERTMAHELGHFLGLWHTTEPDGTVFEPLPDTPACPVENDADGDGFLLAEECVDRGAENLMFWSLSGTSLSADQQDVLRDAMLLR